jgi:hypothetical protein
MIKSHDIDYTALYRAYYARRARWHSDTSLWVAAIAIEIIIAMIACAIMLGAIVALSRARIERVPPMTGFPSIDRGVYPDAHVEEVQP